MHKNNFPSHFTARSDYFTASRRSFNCTSMSAALLHENVYAPFCCLLEHCSYCSDDNVSCKAANTYRLTNISLVGMPMVIYSQILMWGQSSCCLLAICVLNSMGSKIPPMFAAMVPLGDYHISLRNVHALFSCIQIFTRSLCCSSVQMFLKLFIFRCRCYCCFCCCLPLSQGSRPVQIS